MHVSLLLAGLISIGADDRAFHQNVRTTDPRTPMEQSRSFHLPPGFEIQLFAAEPDIQKPLNLAFDGRGRLWVSGSVEYPYAAEEGAGRDAIKVLQDTNNDGRADKITTFVDGLNIPMGLYPYGNGVIAYSIPHIYYFQDTDGDGKCDRRDVLCGPLGNPRDTHGLQNAFRRGLDGWIYVNHGFANTSTIQGRDGSAITLNSGNTYRLRVDGSRAEQFTWGQVNPFGSTFTPAGDLITADCHSKPLTFLLRGGYYSSFGKPHNGLGFAPNLMQHLHGSTGIAGVACCAHQQFPADYHGDLFVGNVVTSRIHRDRLEFHGSSPRAIEQTDFVTSDDPWFRPVDLRMGPDGALYVADFYNRIIGHYEVPLEHPGRDRQRGRIWRIVYKQQAASMPPLDQFDTHELVRALGDPNLTTRMLAMDQLSDRIGTEAVAPLRAAIASADDPLLTVHAAWTLFRMNAIAEDQLVGLSMADDATIRLHGMRMLGETPALTDELQQRLLARLDDADPHVRRLAVEAVGQHPEIPAVRSLLQLLTRTPNADPYLRHTIRIAIRNQLRSDTDPPRPELAATVEQRRELADIAISIPSVAASTLILKHLQEDSEGQAVRAEYLQHVARHLPIDRSDDLARIVQARVTDLRLQSRLLRALRSELASRKMVSAVVDDWGRRLAGELMKTTEAEPRWHPITGEVGWGLEDRNSSDGRRETYLSSLPGGEQRTGILRSPSFQLPATLSFYVCGHRGSPRSEASDNNLVRLRLLDDDRIVRTAYPPRNDTAVRIEWDLSPWKGRRAVFEMVDGLSEPAYAWLAVARFEPDVLRIPRLSPADIDDQRMLAAELAGDLLLDDYEPVLTRMLESQSPWTVREAAAASLLKLRRQVAGSGLTPLITQQDLKPSLRERICLAMVQAPGEDLEQLTRELFRVLPLRHQLTIATRMATTRAEGQTLLDLMAEGIASPRLLQIPLVRESLQAALGDASAVRIQTIVAALPPLDAAVQSLLAERIRFYRQAEASLESGRDMFKKHCASCHQVAGEGSLIGPQLDGIGTRGLERVLEDVIAPHRNVDATFRTSIITLTDGRVVSGLLRARDAGTLVVADTEGKEQRIRENDVEQHDYSQTSIMPGNLAETLSKQALNDLLSYLMSLRNAEKSDADR